MKRKNEDIETIKRINTITANLLLIVLLGGLSFVGLGIALFMVRAVGIGWVLVVGALLVLFGVYMYTQLKLEAIERSVTSHNTNAYKIMFFDAPYHDDVVCANCDTIIDENGCWCIDEDTLKPSIGSSIK